MFAFISQQADGVSLLLQFVTALRFLFPERKPYCFYPVHWKGVFIYEPPCILFPDPVVSPDPDRLRRNLRKARQQELTPRQREMVRLYYDEGMTMPQIGELLGVETSTVTTRLARARRRLKERLGEDWQDE